MLKVEPVHVKSTRRLEKKRLDGYTRVTIWLPPALTDKIDPICQDQMLPKAQAVIMLLEHYFERQNGTE
jgi:hypothetical protein